MASSLLPFLLYSLILQSIFVVAQTKSIIDIGDSFTAQTNSSTWLLSPSGDFAFGFFPLKNTTGLFLLCIWYAKISEKTVVWYANGDSPAPKGSKVEITANDGLVLTSPKGDRLWNTEGLNAKFSRGVFNDTGNIVLQDGDFNSLWETFKFPSDTLLPSQILQKGGKLSSRHRETNFSKGRFELLLQDDGYLVMYSINLPSGYANENYYESGTVGSNTSSAGTQLVFDRSGYLYVLGENNEKYNVSEEESKVSTTQFYLRVTLNFDGVFTLYKHPKSSTQSEGWTIVWSKPDNICDHIDFEGSGICGYNSFCTLGNDKRPTCQCPKSYSLVDPDDPNGSCKPNFIQGCKEDELSKNTNDLYDFEIMINTDWPLSDIVLQRPFTEEQCKKSCMEDCLCSVAIFREGDSCWKKKLPLSNGRKDASLNISKAFLKVRKDNASLVVSPIPIILNKNNNRQTLVLVGSVLFGSSAILNAVLIVAICASTSIFQHKKKLRRVSKSDTCVEVESNLRCFTYEELEEATNGFDKELGRGSVGIVYEGVITNNISSETRVAVKKLNNVLLDQGHREFMNELNVIGLTHHKNLVRLLGFCEGGCERLLVYEYMSNGSLANFLFNSDEKQKPSWKVRLEIAIGIAKGLVYLHEECISWIIHCDIKPQNILLDDYFNARISDFGLAKLLNMNQSKTNTGIKGTRGYVALEWFKNLPINAKVDVYSYGVVLLEIISCRRCVEEMDQEDEEKVILTDWAYDCYKEDAIDALVEGDNEALEDKEKLQKLVMIAIWCVQEDPCLRPTMRNVIHMLEGTVEVQVPPYPSPISIQYSLN
ncbi:G-type lectin S-receptor serine/threonine-protein kinase LECRK3 [Trifolium repens]|nr:G-type lectin S-receptor serine/threonine-protein kinase LECRK3 [Trifolium repens]